MLRLRILALAAIFMTVEAYKLQGCFEDLPSSFSFANEYVYQSSGECAKTCANYDFFALTEGNKCYCGSSASSLADEDTSDECTVPCVGYPQEMCGGDGDAYTVYSMSDSFVLGSSGSSGSSSSSSFGTSSQSTSSSPRTSSSTSTTDTTSSSSVATTSAASNSDESTSVQMYTSVVTHSGSDPVTSVVYVTSVSTPSSESSGNSGGGSNRGALIGGAVGGVVGALIIFSLAFFFTWRRIHNNKSDLSSSSTIDAIYDEAKKRNPKLATNPFEDPNQEYTDHQMNPVALGRRRLSEGSLADEADYSRKVLRVANPDDA
ncbi:hypothetical protein LJB42_002611 [Komagataella kurtzmanii]|nr:hypothetical protein LJB42_002611 [Komagataella kurtzmanii]